MKIILIFVGFCFSYCVSAQETNSYKLQKMSDRFQTEYIENQELIHKMAADKGVSVKQLKKNLVGKFGKFWVFIENLDVDQITSGNVDMLYNNTIENVAVTGDGMIVYQWDGGRADASHQEFTGRLTNMESDEVALSDHATGIAGVLIAQGVSSAAKGMAPAAELMAYDFNNNFNEIASTSIENPEYMISNHSYGYQAGWRWGDYDETIGQGWYWFGYPSMGANETLMHGIYSTLDGYFDQIAHAAPNHLIFRAAGNDRNNGPQTEVEHAFLNDDDEWEVTTAYRPVNCGYTGFDCIPYGSVSKNVITVGSINQIGGSGRYTGPESVTASSFSSFGPTDDGRIKPEIVAQGSSVIMPTLNNGYYNQANGTSMATPSITGIALLLQQIYSQLNDDFLNSAALKALLLNTTNEAGNFPGPDYKFGFGLVDAFQGASLILDRQINEAVIYTGTKFQDDISIPIQANGTGPLRATMVWTDLPTPEDLLSFELNNRTPVLVNDLDLRITNISTSEVHMPWKLDVDNPAAAAVRGDNTVDNTEQILIDFPSEGNYTLTVTNKNNLPEEGQDFALIVSGAGLANTDVLDIQTNEIAIYPNPAKDFIHILGIETLPEIMIINMEGKIVMHKTLTSNQLNINQLKSGVYILLINTGKYTTPQKFIKK